MTNKGKMFLISKWVRKCKMFQEKELRKRVRTTKKTRINQNQPEPHCPLAMI